MSAVPVLGNEVLITKSGAEPVNTGSYSIVLNPPSPPSLPLLPGSLGVILVFWKEAREEMSYVAVLEFLGP